jgi:radical SAM superfamily enzyme YgiQ (UPF0313 family)
MQIVIFTEVSYPGFGRYAGTYRIATELRAAGYEVQVVEFFTRMDQEELFKVIDKFVTRETKLVGFSCTFFLPKAMGWGGRSKIRKLINTKDVNKALDESAQDVGSRVGTERDIRPNAPGVSNVLFGRDDMFEIFEYLKQKGRPAIVVGGARCGLAEDPPFNMEVNYVLRGQADHSIVALADHIFYHSDLKVSYTKGKCHVIAEKDYPVDDFTTSRIQYTDNDIIMPKEVLPLELARGCIFKCAFCSYNLTGKKVWEFNRNPDLVANDLQEMYDKYGSTGFMVCDDTYNDSVDKVERFHKAFSSLSFQPTFSTYARADMMVAKPETIPLLYESGMRSVFFGIETLNHQAGKAIGKGMDPERIKDGLHAAKASPGWNEIVTTSGFIIGLPYETEESIHETYEWLLRDDCPLDSFSPTALTISPTSLMGKNMAKYGYKWDENGAWYSDWMTEMQAKEIALYYSKQLVKKKRARFQFTFFGRMQNIGWTLEDFDNERFTNDESDRRKDVVQYKYIERLMNL